MKKTLLYKSDIIAEVFIADSFIKRLCGYMFRRKAHHEAILFTPCSSIHSFGMKFNIDVLFINDEMRVVKKLENLHSRKVVKPVKGACLVIEAEAGKFKPVKEGENVTIFDVSL